MSDPLARPSVAVNTPSLARWISIAALVLLGSACDGDGPLSPTTAPEAVARTTVSTARTGSATGLATCAPDSKLIGRIALSTADVEGTWWHLTRQGLDAAGVTDYLGTIEGWFGRDFEKLEDAIAFLVAQVESVDKNGNGYVCAYRGRGTRASLGDPDWALTLFKTLDDKHVQN